MSQFDNRKSDQIYKLANIRNEINQLSNERQKVKQMFTDKFDALDSLYNQNKKMNRVISQEKMHLDIEKEKFNQQKVLQQKQQELDAALAERQIQQKQLQIERNYLEIEKQKNELQKNQQQEYEEKLKQQQYMEEQHQNLKNQIKGMNKNITDLYSEIQNLQRLNQKINSNNTMRSPCLSPVNKIQNQQNFFNREQQSLKKQQELDSSSLSQISSSSSLSSVDSPKNYKFKKQLYSTQRKQQNQQFSKSQNFSNPKFYSEKKSQITHSRQKSQCQDFMQQQQNSDLKDYFPQNSQYSIKKVEKARKIIDQFVYHNSPQQQLQRQQLIQHQIGLEQKQIDLQKAQQKQLQEFNFLKNLQQLEEDINQNSLKQNIFEQIIMERQVNFAKLVEDKQYDQCLQIILEFNQKLSQANIQPCQFSSPLVKPFLSRNSSIGYNNVNNQTAATAATNYNQSNYQREPQTSEFINQINQNPNIQQFLSYDSPQMGQQQSPNFDNVGGQQQFSFQQSPQYANNNNQQCFNNQPQHSRQGSNLTNLLFSSPKIEQEQNQKLQDQYYNQIQPLEKSILQQQEQYKLLLEKQQKQQLQMQLLQTQVMQADIILQNQENQENQNQNFEIQNKIVQMQSQLYNPQNMENMHYKQKMMEGQFAINMDNNQFMEDYQQQRYKDDYQEPIADKKQINFSYTLKPEPGYRKPTKSYKQKVQKKVVDDQSLGQSQVLDFDE